MSKVASCDVAYVIDYALCAVAGQDALCPETLMSVNKMAVMLNRDYIQDSIFIVFLF